MKTDFVKVKDLFEERFRKTVLRIPYYQRGYRWRKSEVEALLSDISSEPKGYCLQPIVLKDSTIVDGQQRLTTIALIRQYLSLNDTVAKDLLESDRSKIDKYFFEVNLNAIENAFHNNRDLQDIEAFKCKLNKCCFIVCELDDNENEEEVFMRLNAGKIPLSSAEILKSYYLTDDKQKRNCDSFLSRWQDIERILQDDAFYYFFSHDDNKKNERYYSSRMDFLLEVCLIKKAAIEKGEDRWEKEFDKRYESSPIFAFTTIHDKNISASELIDSLENIIKIMILIFDDTELYNIYGVVSCFPSCDFLALLSEVSVQVPNQVLDILKNKVRDAWEFDVKSLGELDFNIPYQKSKIKDILLLHNAIRSTEYSIRFDYNAYRNDNYDLEHIHARAELKGKKDLQEFCKEVIKGENFNEYEDKKCLAEFLKEFETFCNAFEEEDQEKQNELEAWEDCIWALECGGSIKRLDNSSSSFGWQYDSGEADSASSWRFTSIRNLCLLSASVNRSIGNRSFENKRKRVTEEFLKGAQLPVVTAEIFSVFRENKDYKTSKAAIWDRNLGDKYLENIDKTIRGYLNA